MKAVRDSAILDLLIDFLNDVILSCYPRSDSLGCCPQGGIKLSGQGSMDRHFDPGLLKYISRAWMLVGHQELNERFVGSMPLQVAGTPLDCTSDDIQLHVSQDSFRMSMDWPTGSVYPCFPSSVSMIPRSITVFS